MSDPVLVAERYQVIRPLGRGTFARTLLARDLRLDRQVALKVLHPRSGDDLKGHLRRGSDQVLPAIAERWERGDPIQLLYRPDRDFDSIIITTG